MIKIFCKSATWAFGIISVIFAFVPESFFHTIRWIPAQAVQKSLTDKGITDVELDTIISRIVCYAVVWVIVTLIYAVRHSVTIKGDNYTIQVKYGNLLKETNCKKVINFDECYTTHIGPNPSDIKASSICGQYIQSVGGSLNIQNLIDNAEVKPEECVSRFNHSRSYKPGSIIVNGDALLLAFATLNKAGRAKFFTQDEYIECLSEMCKQIEVHCSQTDVCVPILGSGLTLFEGASLSQQELLNIMIWSYKLSPHKIKAPYKLRIICKKSDGFSLNEIDA